MLAFVVAMGAAWRIRGGWLSLPSTQLARMVPVVVGTVGAVWFFPDAWTMWVWGVSLYLGMIWPWAQWMDMGRVAENDDFIGMSGRGMILTAPAGLLMYFHGMGIIMLVGGFFMGLIYWISWKVRLNTVGGEVGTGMLLAVLMLATEMLRI